jgi:N-acetylneuraminic acid mutarotase/PKD repeat protein
MKKLFTISCFIIMYCSSFAQSWYKIPGMPGTTRARSGAFAIGDTGYIIAGGHQYGPYLADSWGYDSLSQQWFQIANYPGNDDDPISFAINGNGFCVTGGGCCPSYSNSLYEYEPYPLNSWTQLTSLPGDQRTFAVGFAIDSDLYIGGGVNDSATASNANPLHDFWKYNVYTQKWTRLADCPAAGVNAFAVGFAIGGEGYVGTGGSCTYGNSNYIPQQDFWQYDPSTNTWTQVANFGGGPRIGAVAWATCDKAYVGTGYKDIAGDSLTNDIWEYDPVANTWTQVANYEGKHRRWPNVFVIGNTAFVGDGQVAVNPNVDTSDFYAYHPDYFPTFLTAGAISPDTICTEQQVKFKDTSNYSPTNWYWQFAGGTPDTSTADSVTVTYNSTGTYSVTLSAWNNCDSGNVTLTSYITVNPGGIVSVSPSYDSIACGESVTLNVTTSGTTYTWSPSTGLSTTTGSSVIASPQTNIVYTITGASSGGCSLTGYDTVIVSSALPFNILPLDTAFCSSQSAILYVSGGGSEFAWTPTSGITDSTLSGDSVTVSPTATTTYTVTGLNPGGCATSGTDMVTIIPSPGTPTFTQVGDTLSSSSANDNQWYRNDTLLKNDTSQDLVINIPGEYYVIVTNEVNGCSTSSNSADVKLAGIGQLSVISNQLSIYPNPFNNDVFIKINSSAQDVKDWNLQVTDELGRTVFSRLSLDYSNDIDLSNLPGGVYFITVINKTGRAVVPMIKGN